jgi:hypothetical protein
MDAAAKESVPCMKLSFRERAAWVSLLVPFSAGVIICAIYFFAPFEDHNISAVLGVLGFTFLSLVISLVLGIISLSGFQQHRRRLTAWIAGIGVLASGVCGLVVVVLFAIIFFDVDGR